ncbi:inositol-3-phosphate synthase [Terracoccus luteus]|uniref:Myo-inositol-1-phosphate synthase n=1 Tax=Terracoccus luteus TaxID=53356 RepID=A0A839PX38_9MICO|nr:inositol-3-phosphate synthase [Terracoccus luteus]MBB2986595.1 myo-inositol-1-phosphate synthase [Terracoccus luteus]MCP2171816.1 myo-inositol-1-phosphate synthase [Terracoccus luteus]
MNDTDRTGLWLVGARGSVATTVATGLAMMTSRAHGRDGLVTELPVFVDAGLCPLDAIVTGGHDVSEAPLAKRAAALADAGVIPASALVLVGDELDRADERLRRGYDPEEEGQAEGVQRLADDIREFLEREGLARVVVVNVSSTEPVAQDDPAFESLAELESAWAAGRSPLPPSSTYAAAAFLAGAAFVDFTPSTGARVPALRELAEREQVPWGGSDGKTGETLVKSVLAPMFAARALRVRSWSGTNLLGGGDGATLADPDAMASKAVSKARGLEAMLGYPVEGPVHIDNITDLGDWKTAWDNITFSGFLGTRMTMQFTWQGCDSSLAAPLVIDIARLADLALRRGESGPMTQLGFFFKDPVDSEEHQLFTQLDSLGRWACAS